MNIVERTPKEARRYDLRDLEFVDMETLIRALKLDIEKNPHIGLLYRKDMLVKIQQAIS